ncbi:hypothetical protein ACFVUH_27450 [Kitasatospora sp. NPDC058032]|uniref:hypothetical protein n=1 Tax=Kitasatospora sp. NPDC058032 TaxID=3346307 RepID=UPI0036DA0043
MSATCPQCSASDQSVAVPHALEPTAEPPLDEPTRALLAPPPPPQPGRHRSVVATTFYALAGVFAVFGLLGLAKAFREDHEGAETVALIAYFVGALTVPGLLLAVGLITHVVSRRRHERGFVENYGPLHAVWQRNQHVWQAARFCHRCRVVFFPDAALRPDFPASPPIRPEQFPLWVVTAADRAYGFPNAPVAPS